MNAALPPALAAAVEAAIARETGTWSAIEKTTACGGGCINAAQTLELEDGRKFFLKTNAASPPGMFAAEAAGLRALAAAKTIRVPRAVAAADKDGARPAFILMEHIESGSPPRDFMATFGAQLAQLHRATTQTRCGFDGDNYIGSTPQPNGWMEDWVAFWRDRRLGHQLALARRNGHADAEMNRLGERMLERLDELIGEPAEPACLLHGDLWGGNYLCGADGEAVLIDPAAYYGSREAELAMTKLFGGFSREFYAGYEEVWPLAMGAEARIEIYKLYHLLNHLNLFGGGYYGACMGILRRYT